MVEVQDKRGLIEPRPIQIELFKKAIPILREFNLVYLAAQERVGKSLVALMLVKEMGFENVLVVTTKKAKDGWIQFCSGYPIKAKLTFINYESVCKVLHDGYDCFILDEAHKLGGFPKEPKAHTKLKPYTRGKPLIFLSATPSSESYSQLYHQLSLYGSSFKNFYRWFEYFGVVQTVRVGSLLVKSYKKCDEQKIKNEILNFIFVSADRKQAGISVEPVDEVVYVDVVSSVRDVFRKIKKERMHEQFNISLDSPSKLIRCLHQLEGGTYKHFGILPDEFLFKVAYIKNNFDLESRFVIFYEYKKEGELLLSEFKDRSNILILQGTSYAEGVDLSDYDFFVVYSMNFSTSKYIQRRARACNFKREKEIVVFYLLVKGGISEHVYKACAIDKVNFTLSYYEGLGES